MVDIHIITKTGFLLSLCQIEQGTASQNHITIDLTTSSISDATLVVQDGLSFSFAESSKTPDITSNLRSSMSSLAFTNISAKIIPQLAPASLLSQVMVGCTTELSSHHLSGSTIRDFNAGASFLCANSSFSRCLTNPRDDPDDKFLQNYTADSSVLRFEVTTARTISFEKCQFSEMSRSIAGLSSSECGAAIWVYTQSSAGPVTLLVTSCSFLKCEITTNGNDWLGGGAIAVTAEGTRSGSITITRTIFSECKTHGSSSDGGGFHIYNVITVSVDTCIFTRNEAVTTKGSIGGALSVKNTNSFNIGNSSFDHNKAGAGGAMELNTITTLVLSDLLLFSNTLSTITTVPTSTDIWIRAVDGSPLIDTCLTNVLSTSKQPSVFTVDLNHIVTLPTPTVVKVGKDSEAVDEFLCGIIQSAHCQTIKFGLSVYGLQSLTVFVTLPEEYEEDGIVVASQNFAIEGVKVDGALPTIIPSLGTKTLFEVGDGTNPATLSLSFLQINSSTEATTALIEVKAKGDLTLTDITFASVTFSNTDFGSCLVLRADSTHNWADLTFSDVVGQASGRCILLETNTPSVVNSSSLVTLCPAIPDARIFTSEEKEQFHISGTNGGSMLFYWFPHTTSEESTHIHKDGDNHVNCGLRALPCQTLSEGISHTNTKQTFFIDSHLSITKSLTVSSSPVTLQGSSKLTLSIQHDVIFEVTSKSLTLSNFDILPSSSTVRSTSLFTVSTGSLEVTECSFKSFSIDAKPLISHVGGTLTLSSASFTAIRRETGNGSCLHSDLVSGMALLIDDLTIQNVSTKSGFGEGVFISFPTDASSFTEAVFTLKNLHLSTTPSTNSEEDTIPHLVWIRGTTLSSWIEEKDTRFAGSFADQTTPRQWIWTEDINEEIKLETSLRFYLTEKRGPVGVNAEGLEIQNCGFEDVWCPSLDYAKTRLEKAETDEITLQQSLEISTQFDVSSSLTLSGKTRTSQFIVGEGGCIAITGENTAFTLKSLVFRLAPSLTKALISHTQGTLSITSVSFLPLTNEESFTSALISSSSTLSLVDVDVSSATLGAVSLISLSGNVTITDSRFENISSSSNEGWPISIIVSESSQVKILGTSFSNCKVDGKDRWILLDGSNKNIADSANWKGTFDINSPKGGVLVRDLSLLEDEFSLLYLFYPRNSSLITTTSSSSEDHPLCGHELLPCSTVSRSVQMSGVRSVSVMGSCVMGGSIDGEGKGLDICGLNQNQGVLNFDGASRITQSVLSYPKLIRLSSLILDVTNSLLVEGDSVLKMESGKLEIESCSFTSPNHIKMKLIELTNGEVELSKLSLSHQTFSQTPVTLTNLSSVLFDQLTLSDCTATQLFHLTNIQNVKLQHIEAQRFLSPTNANNDTDALCSWMDGVFVLKNCTTTLQSSILNDLEEGAFSLIGGSLNIHSSSFEETHDESTFFPSAHRNIHCEEEGRVVIHSLNGGDGSLESPSLWIDSNDCEIIKVNVTVPSPLFIPTLNTDKSKAVRHKNSSMSVTIVGTMLMPCGLHLEVFCIDETKAETGKTAPIDLNKKGKSRTETSFSLDLSDTVDLNGFDPKFEWRARLGVGQSWHTSESILLKLRLAEERKAQALQAMKWMIPVIVVSILVLIFIIVLVCLLRRRNKNKKEQKPPISEMGDVNVQLDEIKVDESAMDITNRLHESSFYADTDQNTTGTSTAKEAELHKEEGFNGGMAMDAQDDLKGPDHLVDVRLVDGNVVSIRRRDTLYNRLHRPTTTDPPLDQRQVQKQLVTAALALRTKLGQTDSLKELNPFGAFFDKAGVVSFSCSLHPHTQNPDASQSHTTSSHNQPQKGKEGDRWKAPEVADGKATSVDAEKAAVFSLGLMLWEVEKMEVPFSETDAINAQRQLGAGIQPPMTGLPKWLVELIQSCLALDAKERPTLDDLDKKLNQPSLHQPSQTITNRHVSLANHAQLP